MVKEISEIYAKNKRSDLFHCTNLQELDREENI